MKKWRNKILSAVLTLSLLLTSTSFAFAVGEGSTTEENVVTVQASDENELRNRVTNAAADTETIIEITNDIDLTSTVDFAANKKITIRSASDNTTGNPYTIIKTTGFPASGGPMFKLKYNNCSLTLENIIIDGGADWTGEKDDVLDRGTDNNGVHQHGGTLVTVGHESGNVTNSNFTLGATATLQNNDMEASGAAVYNNTGGTVKIYGTIRNNNDATDGGAIYNQESGIVNIYSGAQIYGNSVNSTDTVKHGKGGAIVNAQNGGTINIYGGTIKNNTAEKGGAIYVDKGTVNINIDDTNSIDSTTIRTNITGNKANTDGGAIYINSGTVNVGAANIERNSANWGGAVYAYGGTATFTGTTINGNSARNGCGGAFNVNKSGTTGTAETTVTINDTTKISENTASEKGGAINIQNGTVNLKGGTISGNESSSGGAIALPEPEEDDTTTNAVLNLGAVTFTGNICTDHGSYGDSRMAGNAIMYFSGTLNIVEQPTFTGESQDIYVGYVTPKNINIKCSLSKSSINVTPQHHTQGNPRQFAVIENETYKESAVKAFNFPSELGFSDKAVYASGNAIKYGDKATYSINLDSEKSVMLAPTTSTASTTLTVATTGSEVSYKWYKSSTKDSGYELISGENRNTLTISNLTTGSTYYYCVIDNGEVSSNDPLQSTTCEVKVSDFYPCSQAIDKFKSI